MVFVDHSPRGRDPHLRIKAALLVAGAAVGLLGMRLENGWVVGAAVAILLAAVALRLAQRRK